MPFNFRINDDKSLTFFGADPEYQEELQGIIDKQGTAMAEAYFINEYFHDHLEIVDPETNGDLTDGLIFTDQTHDWWDSDYALDSFLETLFEKGEVTIPYARPNRYIFDDGISAVDWLNSHPTFDGYYAYYAKQKHEVWNSPSIQEDLYKIPHWSAFKSDMFVSNIPHTTLQYVNWGEERDAVIALAQRVSDFAYNIKCVASDHNLFNFIVEHY